MLEIFAHAFFVIGQALTNAERDLLRYSGGGEENEYVTFNHPVLVEANRSLSYIVQLNDSVELYPIVKDARKLYNKISDRNPLRPLATIDVLTQVQELRKDLQDVLRERQFYYLRQDLSRLYGKPELFGDVIAKKFRSASSDLEHAGNCLALGESTACVLHLVRAMERVIKAVSKKFNVVINPKDTWGMILSHMNDKIKNLPEANERQKRKKAMWSECRANLYHVKQAWRDEAMHTNRFYDEREARQILEAFRVFIGQLATL